jgi:tellurite resistance protein
MEGFLALIGVIIAWMIFQWVLSAGARTVGAAAKAAVGKGSFSENMELAFKGMGVIEARLVDSTLDDDGGGLAIKGIEVKGLFPLNTTRQVGFVTSVFDETDGTFKPVLSAIEMFQEPTSIVFQHVSEIGQASPDTGFVRWSRVGGIIPNLLEPPVGGKRQLVALVRLVDLDNMPSIEHGFQEEDDPGILWQTSLRFEYTTDEKGYEEAAEHRDHARALSIKIGMAVAMADGTLDDSEGETLKSYVQKSIAPFSDEKRDRLKSIYNDAMKNAHAEAKTGDLSLSVLTTELNDIADKTSKYETVELCFDVMAADGVADAEELKVIRKVSEALGLDFDEIDKMRDQKILGLEVNLGTQSSIEDMLGIESDWDADKIKHHLRIEFQKWNDRLNTLSEGEERDNAQQMLNLIAEARKKYG